MPHQPTLSDWKTLYDLARQYRELAPWEWMDDTDPLTRRSVTFSKRCGGAARDR